MTQWTVTERRSEGIFTYDASKAQGEWIVRRNDGKTLSLGKLNTVRDAAAAIRMAKTRPHWEWA